MAFWTRGGDRHENGANGASGARQAVAAQARGDGALRAAVALAETNEAQSRVLDGALAGTTEIVHSLRETSMQA